MQIRSKTPWLGLVVILGTALALWWPLRDIYIIGSDDMQLLGVSWQIAAGDWQKLVAPQGPHVIPLYRLVRLYFDLHFPERFYWMHAVAVAAHLASVFLLFVLCREYLQRRVVPLVVAFLFAWHTWGWEAIAVKSQNTYVLSLPCLLGALYCTTRVPGEHRARWTIGCLACLLAAVGLHSLPAVAAIPGVLAGYYLLVPSEKRWRRREARSFWLACSIPFALACGLWAWQLVRGAGAGIIAQHSLGPAVGILSRSWNAMRGVAYQFAFLLWHTPPSRVFVTTVCLTVLALLLSLRKQLSGRFLWTALVLTVGPTFVIFLGRGIAYQIPRYSYQSFVAVAIAAGCVLDLLLTLAERWPLVRICLVAAVMGATPFYWTPKSWFQHRAERVLEGPSTQRDYWLGWKYFFDRASDDAIASSTTFRLPTLRLDSSRSTTEVFRLCYPRGKTGIVAILGDKAHKNNCIDFWRKAQTVRAASSPFDRTGLPPAMAVLGLHQAAPAGDFLVCRCADCEPASAVLSDK